MFREDPDVQSSKLKARNLAHKRIADVLELQKIYTLGEVLGKGNFGTVVKARYIETKVSWAIKIINKHQAGASRVMLVEREIHILRLVNHPNIIFLDRVFETPKTIYLVFELCTGSLAKTFRAKKLFEETETLTVIRSLARALSYLHKNDIVHRDLKLENILIAANPKDANDKLHIKVTDFGLSAMRSGPGHDNMLHDCCGTLTYMAPEMIATKSYSQQCDVWSMGIIMYVLLAGKFPFYSGNEQQLCRLIKKEEVDFSGLSCTPEARHLLTKLLEKNPAFRVTAAEVEDHPWVSGSQSRLQSHSSNVLDMMRMWRDEMMEPAAEERDWVSAGSVRTKVTNTVTIKEDTLETIPELNLDREKLMNESPYSKQRFWSSPRQMVASHLERLSAATAASIDENSQDSDVISTISESPVETTSMGPSMSQQRKEITRLSPMEPRRTSSRLPDFSNIPAKVDTNLANLRRDALAQRRRAQLRSRQIAERTHKPPYH